MDKTLMLRYNDMLSQQEQMGGSTYGGAAGISQGTHIPNTKAAWMRSKTADGSLMDFQRKDAVNVLSKWMRNSNFDEIKREVVKHA